MKRMDFIKGVGLGLVAGAAVGMAFMPHKKPGKKTVVGKALKAAGEIVENVTDAIGM